MDLNARCSNRSHAVVECRSAEDRFGRDIALVVAKMTYSIHAGGELRIGAAGVRTSATGDGAGAERAPDDLLDDKRGTDVALAGTAYPQPGPDGTALAWIQVGALRKIVRLTGPRTFEGGWRGVRPGPAGPLAPLPLVYARAYGGRDAVTLATEVHNPAGCGFAEKPEHLVGTEVPQLEPVNEGRASHPSHGCFAPIPAHWEPRRALMGTHDATWAQQRAPVRPTDFDPHHASWAPPELHSATPLEGDEAVEIGGILRWGLTRFRLPRYRVAFSSVIAGRDALHPTHLDTVFVDTDEGEIELVWRTSILLPRKWELLSSISVQGEGELGPELFADPPHPRASTLQRAAP